MSDAINTQNRLRNTGVSGDTKAGSTAKTKTRRPHKTSLLLTQPVKRVPSN
jgi:hypothetical protein